MSDIPTPTLGQQIQAAVLVAVAQSEDKIEVAAKIAEELKCGVLVQVHFTDTDINILAVPNKNVPYGEIHTPDFSKWEPSPKVVLDPGYIEKGYIAGGLKRSRS